jgi:NAD+ diphosphatase
MSNSRQSTPNPLSDPSLDRAAHRRTDEIWLAAARRSPEALVAPIWQSRLLIGPDRETPRAGLISAGAFDWDLARETVFLGLSEGAARFAADVSGLSPEAAALHFDALGTFENLVGVGGAMLPAEAALLAYGKGMLYWHERHRFCGVCGHPTVAKDGGHRRICTNENCRTEQFPRSDPAVIMRVEHEDKILLARGVRFPPGFQSVLAGFVEPGESLEDTVAREVFEECGIRLADIEYVSSQPWPFPSSLMLGFRARALNTDLTLDPSEIVEAGWYTRDFIRALDPDGPFKVAKGISISGRLIYDWVEQGD